MKYFLFGNFEVKINEKISEFIKKSNSIKSEFKLDSENFAEILTNLNTDNLFGEKNLVVVDLTEAEYEDIEKLCKLIPQNSDILLVYRDNLEKSSKLLKLFSKDYQSLEFKSSKVGNIFNFIDYVVNKDPKRSYNELNKLDDNEVLIFNNIVGGARNILSLKMDLSYKNKIIPFKIAQYKKAAEKWEEVKANDAHRMDSFYTECIQKQGQVYVYTVHSLSVY